MTTITTSLLQQHHFKILVIQNMTIFLAKRSMKPTLIKTQLLKYNFLLHLSTNINTFNKQPTTNLFIMYSIIEDILFIQLTILFKESLLASLSTLM